MWIFCLISRARALKHRQAFAQAAQGELAVRVGHGRFAMGSVFANGFDHRIGNRSAGNIDHRARHFVTRLEDNPQRFALFRRKRVNIFNFYDRYNRDGRKRRFPWSLRF